MSSSFHIAPADGSYLKNVIRSRCTEEGDCLIWPGAMNAGRSPAMTFKGENVQIRRFLWEQSGHILQTRTAIKVRCKEVRCVAEGHLFEGRRGPNVGMKRSGAHRAKMAALQQAKSTLTLDDVAEIRSSLKPLKELAAQYGKAKRTIQNIRAGETWRVVSGPFAGLGAR